MDEKEHNQVNNETDSIHISGDEGESVRIGPGGVQLKDGDSEVRVSWTGVWIRDEGKRVNISCLKPLIGCGIAIILFLGLLTAVIVGIVKLLT